MANHTITIEGINSDGTLKLSDGGVTTASPGDTVTWVIGNNSGLASITGIIDDSTINVFSQDPVPVSSTSWQGTVNPTPPPSSETESYTINYLKIGDSKIYSYDPDIDVNS
jgi:hypothetical protein